MPTPMPTPMHAPNTAAPATADIARIGRQIGLDLVIEYPGWRNLAQIEVVHGRRRIEIPGEYLIADDEFDDFAARHIHPSGGGGHDDRARGRRRCCRRT